MASREIVGLVSAEACEWPTCIPRKSRVRGAKAAGLSYEKKFCLEVGKRFPEAVRGQWFRFRDVNGWGYCQPDCILVRENAVLVLECKLTDTEQARRQLSRLYFPILSHVYGLPTLGIVVVKHLTRVTRVESVFGSLAEALPASMGGIPTLHWLGRGAL